MVIVSNLKIKFATKNEKVLRWDELDVAIKRFSDKTEDISFIFTTPKNIVVKTAEKIQKLLTNREYML